MNLSAQGRDDDYRLDAWVLEAMRPLESFWRVPEMYGEAVGESEDRDVEMRLLRFAGRAARRHAPM
jgi:hypothetical protein